MTGYWKHKPVWMQFFFFIGIAVAIFMVLSLIGLLVLSMVTHIDLMSLTRDGGMDLTQPGMLGFIRGMILIQFIGLFLLPVFLFARLADPDPGEYLGLKRDVRPAYFVAGVGLLLLSLPAVEALGSLNQQVRFPAGIEGWMKNSEKMASEQISYMLSFHSPVDLMLNIIMIALFAGIGEELFFRGVLQRLFIQWFKSPWLGILAAAFVFSAIHLQFYGFLPRFFLGILLGALYWYSGSLWTAILAHFLYDAFFIVVAYFNPEMVKDENATLFNPSQLWLPALLSLAVVAGILWWMRKNSIVRYPEIYELPEWEDTVEVR